MSPERFVIAAEDTAAEDTAAEDTAAEDTAAEDTAMAEGSVSGSVPAADPAGPAEPARYTHADVAEVLLPASVIAARVAELAACISRDYAGIEIVLVGVLKGAMMIMADLARALSIPATIEFMAVASYGGQAHSSGVVRILKDLDRDITGCHVLVVEDIVDSGLTLSWLLRNLRSRGPASVQVCALLRKPEAAAVDPGVRYVGFDIPSVFVVGYGLDHAEHYRHLPDVATLRPDLLLPG